MNFIFVDFIVNAGKALTNYLQPKEFHYFFFFFFFFFFML